MRLNVKHLTICLSALFTLLIVAFMIEYLWFDQNFYWEHFHKRVTPTKNTHFWPWHQEILNFIGGGTETVPAILTEKEKNHLYDVKSLYHQLVIGRNILSGLFLMLIAITSYTLRRKCFPLLRQVWTFCGLFGWIFFVTTLFLLIQGDFPSYFRLFHRMFFIQDSYLFQPGDLLVQMYPLEMFYEIGQRFVFLGLGFFSLLLIMSVPTLVKSNPHPDNSSV